MSREILRIYLARHGQTDWNAEGRTQGSSDRPLNAVGRQQALALKRRLKDVPLDAVYSSTLMRSRETADIVQAGVPVTSLAGLAERSYGKFEGLLLNDPATSEEFHRRRWDPDDTLDGGESLNAFVDRVKGALEAIRAQHASGSILIVSHRGVNQAILWILLGLSEEQTRTIDQNNDDLYLIELQGGHAPRLWKFITEANPKDL